MQDEQTSRIRAEAAVWVSRLHADNRDQSDGEAFRAWLAASPEHAAAFEEADHIWSAVGGLPRDENVRAWLAASPEPAAAYEGEARVWSSVGGLPRGENVRERPIPSRRAVMAGLLAVVAAGSVVALRRPASARVYETKIGEQKHVSLDDGSRLFLDAQTRVSLDFSCTVRAIDMQYGRANFIVTQDVVRPFVVQTTERKIVSSQCSFDVRCDAGQIQVVVIHGEATIEPASNGKFALVETLRSGERLIASADMQQRDRPDLAALLSWQTGFATFEEADLAQAVKEMNRYSTDRLEVEPAIAGLKITGTYRVGDNGAFARSVGKLLPVEIRQQGGSIKLSKKI